VTTGPEQTVNPGGSFQLSQSFDMLVDTMQGLQRTINNQLTFMERQADATARYAQPGMQSLPQMQQALTQQVARYGGLTGRMGGPDPQLTGWGALSSMQNLSIYASQRIGQWVAGMPIFAGQGGGASTGGPSMPAGVTPQGTPSSAAAPAGAGAQAVAAQAASQVGPYAAAYAALGGQPPAGGPGGGGGGQAATAAPAALGGLPGRFGAAQGGAAANIMRLAGARIAMSGGSLGGVIDALRGLPVIGLGADILEKGTDFFQGQFAQGRAFQEVEGGTNLGGQAERLHQAAYQASMLFSPIGATAAGEAFQGVTALGYNRASAGFQTTSAAGLGTPYAQDRQGALNFLYNQFTQTGAPIEESLQTLAIASQNSQINLQNLSEVLDKVSDTAGSAGANADAMRKSFQQAFQQAVGGLGAGPAAPALAGAVTATQAAYGQAFAGTSFAGELSAGRQYLLAGQYGITPGQAQYVARNAPQQYANMISGQNMQFISQLPGMTSQALQSMQSMISQSGGGSAIAGNPDLVNQIANQWLNQWQVPNDINVQVWAQMISALTGVNVTPGNVVQWVIQQVAGNNEAAAAARMPSSSQTGVRSGAATVPAGNTRGAVTGQYGLAQGTPVQAVPGALGARFGMTEPAQSWQQVLTSKSGAAAQAYLSEERRTKQRSPVLESLLQHVAANDQVEVQTKHGARVMSMTDAMKFYPDELMSGSAMVWTADGKQVLGTTSQLSGGLSASEPKGISAEERSAAGSNLGVSASQWRRSHPSSVSAQTGRTVTIDLSQEAKQLLKVLPTNYDQASASGTVPAVPWPSTSSR
jgi:hypothetical protein